MKEKKHDAAGYRSPDLIMVCPLAGDLICSSPETSAEGFNNLNGDTPYQW